MSTLLHFRDFFYRDKQMYFSATDGNALFKMYKDESVAQYIGGFDEEDYMGQNLHSNVLLIGDIAYFIPLNGKGISTFNISQNQIRTYCYKDNQLLRCTKGFYDGKYIYLIPADNRSTFLRFDQETHLYTILNAIMDELKKEKIEMVAYFSFIHNRKIYIVPYGTESLYCYDIGMEKCQRILWSKESMGKCVVADDYIAVTNPKEGMISLLSHQGKPIKTFDRHSGSDTLLIPLKNRVLLFDNEYRTTGVISMDELTIKESDTFIPREMRRIIQTGRMFSNYVILDEKEDEFILFSSCGTGYIHVKNDIGQLHKVYADNTGNDRIINAQQEMLRKKMEKGFVIEGDSSGCNLELFLSVVRDL